jgi:AcrR family transcriptional regulator
MTQRTPRKRGRAKAMSAEQRTEAILAAAAEVFIEQGFDGARVEDVARRAGIAKGTVYLYFPGKEALFRALVRQVAAAPLALGRRLLDGDAMSSAEMLRALIAAIRTEVLESERRRVLRLLLTEGHRFPELAATYHDEVISRGMALIRAIVDRGIRRGEFRNDALVRFPQLLAAPLLLAVLWEGLFDATEKLDTAALLDAHLDLVLAGLRREPA